MKSTRDRVTKLAKLYEEEGFLERERNGARDNLSSKQSAFDVVRKKIDLLETEIESSTP